MLVHTSTVQQYDVLQLPLV